MARDNGQGIFAMDFINEVSRMKSIEEAKAAAHKKVDEAVATDANKQKSNTMVMRSRNIRELVFGMTNFSLSHMGLKKI